MKNEPNKKVRERCKNKNKVQNMENYVENCQ